MVVGEDRFCPKCGAQRQSGMSFCGRCGYGFPAGIQIEPARGVGGALRASDVRPPLATHPAPVDRGSNQVAMLAGMAWILSAAVGGYIAFLQWQYAQVAATFGESPGDYQTSALWNAAGAALTTYFGARCLGDPPRDGRWALMPILAIPASGRPAWSEVEVSGLTLEEVARWLSSPWSRPVRA